MHLRPGGKAGRETLLHFLTTNGYSPTGTVMEAGEFAVRGGMVDLFPPGLDEPLRLDFFGDELDALRGFEPFSQRSTEKYKEVTLRPVSEIRLGEAAIKRFRTGYREAFGSVSSDDLLYEQISAGHVVPGMEHWLPLFHASLSTLFDYLPEAGLVLDHQAGEAGAARWELIGNCFKGRTTRPTGGEARYNPLPRERVYISPDDLDACLAQRSVVQLQPFAPTDDQADGGGRAGQDFSAIRAQPGENVYEALKTRIQEHHQAGQRVLIAAMSEGASQRLASIMAEHDIEAITSADNWAKVAALPDQAVAVVQLGLERGFSTPGLALISEPDILGERLRGAGRRKSRAENFLAEASVLGAGDLVVHTEHGLARFEELIMLEVAGAAH
ncbi:MAG: transcription-repair coupling factor, partial [Rhodospirillales bacterium]|nr:transcription-repair coupling factor [Rhodospirillales bacterium]